MGHVHRWNSGTELYERRTYRGNVSVKRVLKSDAVDRSQGHGKGLVVEVLQLSTPSLPSPLDRECGTFRVTICKIYLMGYLGVSFL